MVDRNLRDAAAAVLEDFVDGRITNVEFEQRFPASKDDPALLAIRTESWFYYSDLSEHTLTGKRSLSREQGALLERCALFLKTALEFQWPLPKYGLKYGLIRLLGFGWLLKRREKKEMSMGDVDVWPFLKRSDYERALGQQREPENR